jgi:hypothetical protein
MTKLIRADELLHMPNEYPCELVAGRIVRTPFATRRQSKVIGRILHTLTAFVASADLGVVGTGRTGFHVLRDPDTVRVADIAFISHETLARLADSDEDGYF